MRPKTIKVQRPVERPATLGVWVALPFSKVQANFTKIFFTQVVNDYKENYYTFEGC